MRYGIMMMLLLLAHGARAQEVSAPSSVRPSVAGMTSFRDAEVISPLGAAGAATARLDRLTEGKRANAIVALDATGHRNDGVQRSLTAIAEQWNSGDFDGAITRLGLLETTVPSSLINISVRWKQFVPSALPRSAGADLRVGTLDTVSLVAMACDQVSGHLMSVVRAQYGGGAIWWFTASLDGGATWRQMMGFSLGYTINSVSITTLKEVAYVGFTCGPAQTEIRLYRFWARDASQIPWWNNDAFLTVGGVLAPESIKEVSLGSNDAFSALRNKLYVSTLSSTHRLRFFVYTADSTTALEIPTGVTSAKQGLSTCYTHTGAFMWFSYVDTLGQVCIDSLNAAAHYARAYRFSTAYDCSHTSIDAHMDTILCAFDCLTPFTQTQYTIRYGATSVWRYGTFADTSLGSEMPVVSLAGNAGITVAYRSYDPVRTIRVVHRDYPMGSAWSTRVKVSDYEPYYVSPTLAHLGGSKFGVMYVSWVTNPYRCAYFDTYDLTATSAEHVPTLADRFILEQNYPNPFNPSTTLRWQVPEQARVRLTVYDVMGREVAVLLDAQQEPGIYELRWDARHCASGVYLCTMTAGRYAASQKMLLLK